MKEPLQREFALRQLFGWSILIAVVAGLTVQMLGGGWLGGGLAFLGVMAAAALLARRVWRHYDSLKL